MGILYIFFKKGAIGGCGKTAGFVDNLKYCQFASCIIFRKVFKGRDHLITNLL